MLLLRPEKRHKVVEMCEAIDVIHDDGPCTVPRMREQLLAVVGQLY